MAIGFNSEDIYETKREMEGYIGRWYLIHKQNNSFVGRVIGIREGEVTLKPYKGFAFKGEGLDNIMLIEDRSLKIPILNREGLEEVSEKWVKARIEYENLEIISQKEKDNNPKK